jgi:hypothetical protein
VNPESNPQGNANPAIEPSLEASARQDPLDYLPANYGQAFYSNFLGGAVAQFGAATPVVAGLRTGRPSAVTSELSVMMRERLLEREYLLVLDVPTTSRAMPLDIGSTTLHSERPPISSLQRQELAERHEIAAVPVSVVLKNGSIIALLFVVFCVVGDLFSATEYVLHPLVAVVVVTLAGGFWIMGAVYDRPKN